MTATSQTRSAVSASRLARAYAWLKRNRANARARRTLAQVDTRTLRDLGFTRREIATLSVACALSSDSR